MQILIEVSSGCVTSVVTAHGPDITYIVYHDEEVVESYSQGEAGHPDGFESLLKNIVEIVDGNKVRFYEFRDRVEKG